MSVPLYHDLVWGQTVTPELMEKIAAAEDDGGELVWVVGVGERTTVSDVTIELLAVEIRERAGRLSVVVRSPRQELTMGSPMSRMTDDLGTEYLVVPGNWGSSGSGARAEYLFVPAPPPQARSLTVEFTELAALPFPPMIGPLRGSPTRGPWTFKVPLQQRGP